MDSPQLATLFIDVGWAYLAAALVLSITIRELLRWSLQRPMARIVKPLASVESIEEAEAHELLAGGAVLLVSMPALIFEALVSTLVLALAIGSYAPDVLQRFGYVDLRPTYLFEADGFLRGVQTLGLEDLFGGNALPLAFCLIVMFKCAWLFWFVFIKGSELPPGEDTEAQAQRLRLIFGAVLLVSFLYHTGFAMYFADSPGIVWGFLILYRPLLSRVSKFLNKRRPYAQTKA